MRLRPRAVEVRRVYDQAEATRAFVTTPASDARTQETEENVFVSFASVLNFETLTLEETRQKETDKMQRQVDITELISKVDGLTKLSADFCFAEGSHEQAQAELFFVCVSFQHGHFVLTNL